jgi:glyoxylase-like metal-dependent hydrolase (beta-lactamase superfamily II)
LILFPKPVLMKDLRAGKEYRSRKGFMLTDRMDVLRKGDESGNGMLVRLELPSGLEIFGLPTENAYGGGWDLGPTWNYLVMDEKPFLVDTGKTGMGGVLLEMIQSAGLSGQDLDFVMVSHGHEDHDGSLADIAGLTGARVRAHEIYDRLIRFYPEMAPSTARRDFPASCWRCFMPESYSTEYCVEYHKAREKLMVDAITEDGSRLAHSTVAWHVPGHSPDSLALFVAGEAVIVGDTLLPGITPWPSQEEFFGLVQSIINPPYESVDSVYGLRAYIRSLRKLKDLGRGKKDLTVLPAHRLYFEGTWNDLDLVQRADELIEHHVQRCGAMLHTLDKGPGTAGEIAVAHFDEPLLRGFGMLMAENEVISHCELLIACGDVVREKDGRFTATGTTHFESYIRSLEPE